MDKETREQFAEVKELLARLLAAIVGKQRE